MTTNKPKTFVCLLHRCDFQAAVIKLAQEFWCGQEPSPVLIPNFVIISGHVVECAPSKVPNNSKVRENAIITTIDDKDIVKKDDSANDATTVVATIVSDSLTTDREDGAKQSQEEEEEEEVRENRNCALFRSSVRTHEGWLAKMNGCDLCFTGYGVLLAVSQWLRLFTMIDRLKFVVFPIFRSNIGQRFIARFSFYNNSPNRVQSFFKSEAYVTRPCFKRNSGQVQEVRQ